MEMCLLQPGSWGFQVLQVLGQRSTLQPDAILCYLTENTVVLKFTTKIWNNSDADVVILQ